MVSRIDDADFSTNFVASSPIHHVISAKRVEHLRCILRCKPVGLVGTLCAASFEVLEEVLPTCDVREPQKDDVPDAEENNDRHSIAERFAQEIVDHDARGLAALVDALGQDTDLAHAIQVGRVQTTQYLVKRGVGTKYLSAALGVACSYNYTALATVLEEHGAIKEKPAVARALRRQLFQTATNLIAAGYEVNGRFFEQRRTALHYAVQHDRPAIVRLLLEHGAKVQVYDRDGLQPHHLAAKLGLWECFTLLEGYGADVKLPDLSGWTINRNATLVQARANLYIPMMLSPTLQHPMLLYWTLLHPMLLHQILLHRTLLYRIRLHRKTVYPLLSSLTPLE